MNFFRDNLASCKNYFLPAAAFAVLFLAGCGQQSSPEETVATPAPVEESVPPVGSNTPATEPTPAGVVVPPKEIAASARKVLYLKRRISISNDAGIFGFPVGSEVEIVSRKADVIVVTAKGIQFEVTEADTTADSPGTVAAPSAAAEATPSLTAAQQSALEATQAEQLRQATLAKKAKDSAARQARIFELRAQILALEAKARALRAKINTMRDPNKTPEGRARIAEVAQIRQSIDATYLQISQVSAGR